MTGRMTSLLCAPKEGFWAALPRSLVEQSAATAADLCAMCCGLAEDERATTVDIESTFRVVQVRLTEHLRVQPGWL